MRKEDMTTENIVRVWESRRDIKNLMGRYANDYLLNRQGLLFGRYWSGREDICYGRNDGWYVGREEIREYYNALAEKNKLIAEVLRKRFPEKLSGLSEEETSGIGEITAKPGSSPVIEIAEDLQTAKALWHIHGTYTNIDSRGPIANFLWGYYAVDYVLEDGQWKIWHMQEVYDVDSLCEQSWGKPIEAYPELPEFADMKAFSLPAPGVLKTLRRYYTPTRPIERTPRIPEAYATFDETFSYGI